MKRLGLLEKDVQGMHREYLEAGNVEGRRQFQNSLDMGTEGLPGVWLGPWMQRWRCSPLRQETLVKSRCAWVTEGFWTQRSQRTRSLASREYAKNNSMCG